MTNESNPTKPSLLPPVKAGIFEVEHVGNKGGKDIYFYTTKNKNGLETTFSNLGCAVISLKAPDREGKIEEVNLGYDTPDEYMDNPLYLGLIVGRFVNRIGNACFTLDGKRYDLSPNEGKNHLHGGEEGFSSKVWSATLDDGAIVFRYESPDGEMGYPGNLSVTVKYTLTDDNALDVQITALTDADTIVNMTCHAYWNLSGNAKKDILNHQVTIDADSFTPTDKALISTGEFIDVTGTPIDFRIPHTIGERINDPYPHLRIDNGYNQNFMLNGEGFRKVVTCYDPESGRKLDIFSNQPAVQMYTANGLKGTNGRDGRVYGKNWGVAFELQFPPNSPNHPDFPNAVLRKGGTYLHHTRFLLSTE